MPLRGACSRPFPKPGLRTGTLGPAAGDREDRAKRGTRTVQRPDRVRSRQRKWDVSFSRRSDALPSA